MSLPEALGEGEAEAVPEWAGVALGLAPRDRLAVGLAEIEGVPVRLAVRVSEAVRVALGVGLGVGLGVALPVPVAVPLGVPLALRELL